MKKTTLLRLLRYVSRYKFRLLLVFASMIAGSVCSVRAVYYMKPLINDIIVPLIGAQSPDLSEFWKILALMGLLYLVSVVSSLLQSIIMVNVSNDIMFRIRRDMFRVMEHFPMAYFDRNNRGRIMSYYSNDVDALSKMLRQSLPRIVQGITSMLTILVTIFTVNLRMALVVVACVAVITLILRLQAGNKSKFFSDQQRYLQELNACGEEMISGRAEVKAFSREKRVSEDFAGISARLSETAAKADFFANSMFDFTSGLNNLGFAAVAVTGSVMAMGGLTDAGTVGVFLQYYKNLLSPVSGITKQVSNVFEAMAGAERVFSFLDTEPEEDEGDVTLVHCLRQEDGSLKEVPEEEKRNGAPFTDMPEVPAQSSQNAVSGKPRPEDTGTARYAWKLPSGELRLCEGRLSFSHVDFGYEKDHLVLKDLTFDVLPGQTVAFVGTTGAGKTTVMNLLSRFYEIASGSITFDGIDVRNIRKDSLRRAAGVVLQDTHLFTGTVEENIRFGNLQADHNEVEEAAKVANADYFIRLMQDGYDTRIAHDGASLSQGERQLLSIARAAAGQFPVLVLDEATSSIDSRTELLVSRGLESLMKGKTVLVIAHRLSTIRGADKIIVLDKGRIAEAGTHSQLMEQKGIYYGLYTGAVTAVFPAS